MRAYIQKPCCNLHCSTACECYAALSLELGTGGNESLAGFVGFVFLEVLDEAGSEVVCLYSPFFGVLVSVAGVEDFGVDAGEFGLSLIHI